MNQSKKVPPEAFQLLVHLTAKNYVFSCVNNGGLRVTREEGVELTTQESALIKKHKLAIINYLKQHPKNRAYSFAFADNKGEGSYITDADEKQARQEFAKKFLHYDLASFGVINETAH